MKRLHKKRSDLGDATEDNYSLQIASLYGEFKFKKDKIKSKKIKVNTSNWKAGIYYLQVSNSKGETKNKAIIIK